jgi:hypothetical protein
VLFLIVASPAKSWPGGNQKERNMGTIIDFPADAVSRRPALGMDGAASDGMGTILILPVVRIEREGDETSDGRGPEEGTAPGRRRRRRT